MAGSIIIKYSTQYIPKNVKHQIEPYIRGGVKLGFVRNSFDSIRKFTIRLIRNGKKSSKNSINFNSKFVRFERKKFEKFANFSNSVFRFDKFEILFLSNIILCILIFNFDFKGTLF